MDTVLPEILQHILSWSSELDQQLLRSANKHLHNLIPKTKNDILFLCAQQRNLPFFNVLSKCYINRVVKEAVYKEDIALLDWCIENRLRNVYRLDRYIGKYGSIKVANYPKDVKLEFVTIDTIVTYAIAYTQLDLLNYYKYYLTYNKHCLTIETNPVVKNWLGDDWVRLRESQKTNGNKTLGELLQHEKPVKSLCKFNPEISDEKIQKAIILVEALLNNEHYIA